MLRFRPHHFLCTLGFQGKGYSSTFVKNYTKIVEKLLSAEDELMIEVVSKTDDICAPCPNRLGRFCNKEAKIASLDCKHAKILGLKTGERLTWAQAKQKLKKHMSVDAFAFACQGCPWKDYGFCEAALVNLQAEGTNSAKKKSFKTSPNRNGATPEV